MMQNKLNSKDVLEYFCSMLRGSYWANHLKPKRLSLEFRRFPVQFLALTVTIINNFPVRPIPT
jgi:hypothetical protein